METFLPARAPEERQRQQSEWDPAFFTPCFGDLITHKKSPLDLLNRAGLRFASFAMLLRQHTQHAKPGSTEDCESDEEADEDDEGCISKTFCGGVSKRWIAMPDTMPAKGFASVSRSRRTTCRPGVSPALESNDDFATFFVRFDQALTSMANFDAGFFSKVLGDNGAALTLRVERYLRDATPNDALVACSDLDVEQYSSLGHCSLRPTESPPPHFCRYWGGEDHDQLFSSFEQVVWEVDWQDQTLQVVSVQWETSCGSSSRDWIVASSIELAEAFLLDVERKTHAPGEAILVFKNGYWRRSSALFETVQSSSFDDLVLADDLKRVIRQDFNQFLKSETRYNQLGTAWRRGALLIGPPGNGKTHCVRALIKELDVPCLYVQSLAHSHYTSEQMWDQVFSRARGLRPCVLVLEDLDSLVDDENRSFFLNQLDGFQRNHGMMILATTNHVDRIDSSIVDRPSRFDRKYHFRIPTKAQRSEFFSGWQKRLAQETGWDDSDIDHLAMVTDGFSFAYLKELVVSSVMQWMHDSNEDFSAVASAQASLLGAQMKTEVDAPPVRRRRRRDRGST